MKKYVTVLASFIIMLALGGVYAWSIIASELIEIHGFSTTQTQIIFGLLIAIFPISMILVGHISKKIQGRYLGYISSLLFLFGYLLAGHSNGNFSMVLTGIGILGGIATGFGYWVSLTIPVQWFPERKGLITGIAAAGFGLGAILFSFLAEIILSQNKSVYELLIIIGSIYSLAIFILSNFIIQKSQNRDAKSIKPSDFLFSKMFYKLSIGIFLGTFAGLLVIGSLKLIGHESHIPNNILVLGISIFAVANFLGRLFWGWISDTIGAVLSIFFALLLQSMGILLLDFPILTNLWFLVISFVIGFGFGGNFVLFAKETAQTFGLKNLGVVYPFVFLGYSIAGIFGPLSGGLLFDFTGSYTYALFLAGVASLVGAILFLYTYLVAARKRQ